MSWCKDPITPRQVAPIPTKTNQKAETTLDGALLTTFEVGMLLISALLMAKMCLWMTRHCHELKGRLERDIEQSLSRSRILGVTVVVALSIAIEGAEVVIYLFSMGATTVGHGRVHLLFAALCAVILTAAATFAFQASVWLFNPKLWPYLLALKPMQQQDAGKPSMTRLVKSSKWPDG